MITDQFGVFFDDEAAAATMTSQAVRFMPYAGREDPIYVSLLARGANAAAVTFAVTVQESADNSTFTDVGAYSLSKPDAAAALAVIRLPLAVKEKHVRLSVAVTGTVTGVTLFAGVTREHFAPYDDGLYIDKGRVIA
jgi:hypothetical protein